MPSAQGLPTSGEWGVPAAQGTLRGAVAALTLSLPRDPGSLRPCWRPHPPPVLPLLSHLPSRGASPCLPPCLPWSLFILPLGLSVSFLFSFFLSSSIFLSPLFLPLSIFLCTFFFVPCLLLPASPSSPALLPPSPSPSPSPTSSSPSPRTFQGSPVPAPGPELSLHKRRGGWVWRVFSTRTVCGDHTHTGMRAHTSP